MKERVDDVSTALFVLVYFSLQWWLEATFDVMRVHPLLTYLTAFVILAPLYWLYLEYFSPAARWSRRLDRLHAEIEAAERRREQFGPESEIYVYETEVMKQLLAERDAWLAKRVKKRTHRQG